MLCMRALHDDDWTETNAALVEALYFPVPGQHYPVLDELRQCEAATNVAAVLSLVTSYTFAAWQFVPDAVHEWLLDCPI